MENNIESKGLQVNKGKAKITNNASGKYPCGVCKKIVGRNCVLLFLQTLGKRKMQRFLRKPD